MRSRLRLHHNETHDSVPYNHLEGPSFSLYFSKHPWTLGPIYILKTLYRRRPKLTDIMQYVSTYLAENGDGLQGDMEFKTFEYTNIYIT